MEYLQAKEPVSLNPSDPIKKELLTSKPAYNKNNHRPIKYTKETDNRIDELLEFDCDKAKKWTA